MANTNTNNDTQELDKKKETLSSSSSSANSSIKNIGSFLLSVFITILLIVGYFIIGSIVLYECKLAQSNILPTSLECYPYTETSPEIQKVMTNIFITNTEPVSYTHLTLPTNREV